MVLGIELTTVWFVLIAVLWIGYFVLEGFDFGVGVLLPMLGSRRHGAPRHRSTPSARSGTATRCGCWSAGGATFAAFPEWYATLFSGFYLPLLLILVALIVRGVAFEFRGKRRRPQWRSRWDRAIFCGSLLPAFLWGVAFGNIVRGVPLRRRPRVHRQPASRCSTRTRCSAGSRRCRCSSPTVRSSWR